MSSMTARRRLLLLLTFGASAIATARKVRDTKAAIEAVAGIDGKVVRDRISTLQTDVQNTLATLSVQLGQRIEDLANLDTVIEQRKADLKEIHSIEVVADTLQTVQQELVEAEAASEKRMSEMDAEYDEREAARSREWTREEAEHNYGIDQRNKRDEATLKAQSEERQRIERIRMDDVNKRLDERIEAVALRERAMNELEAQVAGMPQAIEEAVEKAVAESTTSLNRSHSFEKRISEKDAEAKLSLLQAQVNNLQEALKASEARNAGLAKAASEAQEQSKQIALSAVQAQSGQAALAAVQRTVETTGAQTSGRR